MQFFCITHIMYIICSNSGATRFYTVLSGICDFSTSNLSHVTPFVSPDFEVSRGFWERFAPLFYFAIMLVVEEANCSVDESLCMSISFSE